MSHLRSFVILKQQLNLPYYRHYVAKIGTQYRHYGRIRYIIEFNKLRRCDIIDKIKESQIRHYLISITYILFIMIYFPVGNTYQQKMKTDTTTSPQGINLKKCECPTNNKHAYLFILWICKSYGLFFSYRFALSKGCLKSIFSTQTTQNVQINAILLNWNSANNILLYKSYLRKFVLFALFACF